MIVSKKKKIKNLNLRKTYMEKEINKYEMEFQKSLELRDKTYLSFSTLGATILGWIITTKLNPTNSSTTILKSINFHILYLIIIYLLLISFLSLISICLTQKGSEKQILNYQKTISLLNKNKKKIEENQETQLLSSKKTNKIIYDNIFYSYILKIDEILIAMTLFIIFSLVSLFLYLAFPLIVKLYYERSLKSLWVFITFCINIAILYFLFSFCKNSNKKYK